MTDVHRGSSATVRRLADRESGALGSPEPGGQEGIPRRPASLVQRSALHRRLSRRAALTILDALPGFGATTLVAAWVHEERARGTRAIWFRTPEDPGIIDTLRGLTDLRSPVVVVVDDAHLAGSALTDALVETVRVAHQVHLVVLCASSHHFHDAAVDHDVETNVLHGRDLCVPADDVTTFAAAWGHDVDAATAADLHEVAGGWLLPMRLVLDATPAWSGDLATHAADAFLRERVIPQLVAVDQLEAAMRLAVPAELDPQLAVLLVDDEATVAELERQGALWRVPSADGVVRWHFPRLLRRALLLEFGERDDRGMTAANGVVARALSARESPDAAAAVHHARLAGSWELLARLWSSHGWPLLASDPAAFSQAYAPPAPTGNASLSVAAALAAALGATPPDADWRLRTHTLLRHYAQVGAAFLARPVGAGVHPTELIDRLTAAMVSRRTDGHTEDALALAAQLEAALARPRPTEETIPPTQAGWARIQAAATYSQAGSFGDTHRLALVAHESEPDSLVGAGAASLLAVLHAGSGHRAETERWLDAYAAVDLTDHWTAPLVDVPARLARATLAMDRLDADAARTELADTSLSFDVDGTWTMILGAQARYALLFGDPMTMLARIDHLTTVAASHLANPTGAGRQVLDRCSADLLLALGEVDRVRAMLDRHADLPRWLHPPAARSHLLSGEAPQAAQVARAGTWRGGVSARDRMELLVLSTLAFLEQGRTAAAYQDFRRAHALGTHTGNLEPYLLMESDTRDRLLADTGLGLDAGARARLAAARRPYPASAKVTRLTPRELVVLREMAHHDTTAGIARALSVSVNTVKKQLVAVYAKLGVHDRPTALIRARRLGLLDGGRTTSG